MDKPDHLDIFSDIEGFKINGLTIPSNIVITQQRPDIVLRDQAAKPHTVWLFELSVTFERSVEQAHTRKKNRYAYLVMLYY